MTKFSAFNSQTSVASGDEVVFRDISEAAATQNARITFSNFAEALETEWGFDMDRASLSTNTGILAIDGTTSRITIDQTGTAFDYFSGQFMIVQTDAGSAFQIRQGLSGASPFINNEDTTFQNLVTDGGFYFDDPLGVEQYALAGVPDAATHKWRLITITDAIGGAKLAHSDGTNWIPMGVTQTAKISLTEAQIESLHTTPITLVAAPGAGKFIQVLGLSFYYNFVTAAYNTVTTRVGHSGVGDYLVTEAALLAQGADRWIVDTFEKMVATSTWENVALVIDNSADAGTTGDSLLDVYVTYAILDV